MRGIFGKIGSLKEQAIGFVARLAHQLLMRGDIQACHRQAATIAIRCYRRGRAMMRLV